MLRCFVAKMSNVAILRFWVVFFFLHILEIYVTFLHLFHHMGLLGLLRTFLGKLILAQTLLV